MPIEPKGPSPARDFRVLSAALRTFNAQYSLAAALAPVLGASVEERRTFGAIADALRGGVGGSTANPSLLVPQLLKNTGLALFAGTDQFRVFGPVEQPAQGPMDFLVGQRSDFIGFLQSLSPEALDADLKGDLVQLAIGFETRVAQDPTTLDPFGSQPQTALALPPMLEHFERLGIHDEVASLTGYVRAQQGGYLKEHLGVMFAGLLQTPDRFGPATWHKDSTPERLAERWNGAIDILERLTANPNASELYRTLAKHLPTCLNHALNDVKEGTPFRPALYAAQKRLDTHFSAKAVF